ncbi:MAG: hypothetical protein RSB38_00920 [Oscillospiraceae bacterium]
MKKNKLIVLAVVITLILTALGGLVAFSEPGDTDDPVVTKSYIVDKVIPDIKAYVEEKISGLSGGGAAASFVVVDVPNGKKIVCESGTEMILRMGSAEVIATKKGGLADTTWGYDLGNGEEVPSNHLLISPVSDGRGMVATSDAIVMIKGGYTLK